MPRPGWLKRQFDRAAEELKSMPAWLLPQEPVAPLTALELEFLIACKKTAEIMRRAIHERAVPKFLAEVIEKAEKRYEGSKNLL